MQVDTRPKIIGARVQRKEDPRLLTGSGKYTDDRKLVGMVHLAFRRSDHAHAKILNIDATDAIATEGVLGVYTSTEFDDIFEPILPTSNIKDYYATPLRPLAKDIVRYVGEPVAVIVASSRYIAEDAAALIEIDYEPLPEMVDPEAAASDGAFKIHANAKSNVLVSREFGRGDVTDELARSAVRVGGRFRFHRKTPVAIENRSYAADFDKGDGRLTLYSSTQVPGIIKDAIVDALDIPGHKVRVIAGDVGGGFGGKGSVYPEELTVSLVAKHLGRPVKWTSDRIEDLTATSQAFDEIVDAELGLDETGKIVALKADVIGDVGAYSIYPWTAGLEPVQVVSFLPGPYRVPAYNGKVRGVATNKAPTGPYRGVGRPAAVFVMERLIDMAAVRLAIDPADLRRANLVADNEFPYKTGSGLQWDQSGFTGCLEAAIEEIDYKALRSMQKKARDDGRWFGIGVASYAELTGIGSRISAAPGMPINTGTETATIRIDSTGAVIAQFGIASHGQGLETTLAQVVAEELGVKVEDVEIVQGDTAGVAHSTGTYASRSTVLAGGAATLSSRAVREKVIEAASHLMEADTDNIDIREGMISVSGTNRKMSMRELAKAVYSEMGRLPHDVRGELNLEATKLYDPYFGTTTSATHIAAIEIDPETYQLKFHRYVVAEDCGRIINPQIVDGQVHGGVAQGIGAALYEEVVHDETGQILTASLVDYVVPSAVEIPHMDVVHLETESPSTLGGYRGMGEGGTIGAPAAVANAIADALAPLGIEINELPVTPERLFRLIENAKSKGGE